MRGSVGGLTDTVPENSKTSLSYKVEKQPEEGHPLKFEVNHLTYFRPLSRL